MVEDQGIFPDDLQTTEEKIWVFWTEGICCVEPNSCIQRHKYPGPWQAQTLSQVYLYMCKGGHTYSIGAAGLTLVICRPDWWSCQLFPGGVVSCCKTLMSFCYGFGMRSRWVWFKGKVWTFTFNHESSHFGAYFSRSSVRNEFGVIQMTNWLSIVERSIWMINAASFYTPAFKFQCPTF